MPTTPSKRSFRRLLRDVILHYKKFKKRLNPRDCETLNHSILALDSALQNNNLDLAHNEAQKIEQITMPFRRKSAFDHIKELFIALVVALFVAVLVRQLWFEPYEIPTGSMRPTFREQDRVIVSKNTFGINAPFTTAHLLFQPNLLKRGAIVVFTVDGLDLPDTDTMYFYIFPAKKRYVKRCLGLPGDTLYFYGGNLYGTDKNGNEITDFHNVPYLCSYEHLPFMSFEGLISKQFEPSTNSLIFSFQQMHIPIARQVVNSWGKLSPQVWKDGNWKDGNQIENFWGFKNFALSRLILPDDLPDEAKILGYAHPQALAYLELKHNPRLPIATKTQDMDGFFQTDYTWLPLQKEECTALENALYTSRFIVKNGYGFLYSHEFEDGKSDGVFLSKKIPDGTYEFFNGIAYRVGFGAITRELPRSHPIYPQTIDELKTLFNCGINFSALFNQSQKYATYFPTRIAYFNTGTLYLLGKPIYAQSNPLLKTFTEREMLRTRGTSYTPFLDPGPPIKNGMIDQELLAKHGLKIPEKHYLALGDNYSNSYDSRLFGFVPEQNIQGSPAFVLWPPGHRFGVPAQPNVPFLRIENFYIYSLVAIVLACIWYWYRKHSSIAYFKTLLK